MDNSGYTFPRIMVAEDNEISQRLIGLLFRKAGYEPFMARNGLEAFQEACARQYDIIFMDIMMPEMDGAEATEQILAQATDWPPPVIIAMTAGVDSETTAALMDAGVSDFLPKPFTQNALAGMLQKWLRNN